MPTLQEKKQAVAKNAPIWIDIFKKLKISNDMIKFMLAQMFLESAYFTSNAYKIDNNPGGITWNANYKKRPGTSIGIPRRTSEGGNYVHFNNLETAAKDYIRILSREPGEPIKATDAIDFARRLHINGYYDTSKTSEIAYTKTLNALIDNGNDWAQIDQLLEKKNNLNMANVTPWLVLIVLGTFFFKK